jgi:hypothetical protein
MVEMVDLGFKPGSPWSKLENQKREPLSNLGTIKASRNFEKFASKLKLLYSRRKPLIASNT